MEPECEAFFAEQGNHAVAEPYHGVEVRIVLGASDERELGAALLERRDGLRTAYYRRGDAYSAGRDMLRENVPVRLRESDDMVEGAEFRQLLVLLPFVENPVVPCHLVEKRHLVGYAHELYFMLHEDRLHAGREQHPEREVGVELHLHAVEALLLAELMDELHETVGEFGQSVVQDGSHLEQFRLLRNFRYMMAGPALHLPFRRRVEIRQQVEIGVHPRERPELPPGVVVGAQPHLAVPCLLQLGDFPSVELPGRKYQRDLVELFQIVHH